MLTRCIGYYGVVQIIPGMGQDSAGGNPAG